MIIGIDGRAANEGAGAGIATFCREIIRALAPILGPEALRIYLDRPPGSAFPLTAEAADIRILPQKKYWMQRVLAQELRRQPPDCFFSITTQLPLLTRCPSIATILDLAYFRFPDQFTRYRRAADQWALRIAVRKATRLVAISECTKEDLLAYSGMDPDHITVAPLGVSAAFFQEADPDRIARLRSTYKLPDRFLLYLGRIQPRKNLVRLIQAWEAACTRQDGAFPDLVLAGAPGWMGKEIYATAARSVYHERIHFTGCIEDNEDIPALLHAAEAFALVSLWEGFGLPVAEAMACGVPVLAANTSALPEVAGAAALLVDPEDQDALSTGIEDILLDAPLRARLIEAGKQRAQGYRWERTAAILFKAFEQVCRPAPSA